MSIISYYIWNIFNLLSVTIEQEQSRPSSDLETYPSLSQIIVFPFSCVTFGLYFLLCKYTHKQVFGNLSYIFD